MKLNCVWEHNGSDSLLYSTDYPGAFTRGASREIALGKMRREVISYLKWSESPLPVRIDPIVAENIPSGLNIRDADSDVLFQTEAAPLSREEYEALKALALKSAEDFLALYQSIPDPDQSCLEARTTFYGTRPRTAREMYAHTKNVNSYYFGEIGVDTSNEGTIYDCRKRGFEALERQADFLTAPPVEGSYGELWSLRKVLRRFLWHDRIHARAMFRMGEKTFGNGSVSNVFQFDFE